MDNFPDKYRSDGRAFRLTIYKNGMFKFSPFLRENDTVFDEFSSLIESKNIDDAILILRNKFGINVKFKKTTKS